MATVRDLVTGSLRLIEEVGAGQTATAESAVDALTTLNQMLGIWSAQGDIVYTETRETYTLTAGDASYSWGIGGDINSARPVELVECWIEWGGLTYPVVVDDWQQYALITDKSQPGLPTNVYFDANSPTSNLFFWLVPDQAYTLHLYSIKPLAEFSSLNDTLSLPPGWEEALKYNLAMRLAAEYGKEPKPTVREFAVDSKNMVRLAAQRNKKHLLRSDPALQVSSSITGNIYQGYWRR